MNPQRFQRVADLFLRARSLGLSERDDYLARECAGDAELRASVEGLIAGAEGQLPFAELAAELGGVLAPLGADGSPAPDSRIGPYRLLEKLGEGGFGVVYMAEQTEPVRRRVALKIVRQGLDTRQVIARFEAERQALALMDHPNITRVFDAGATAHGRPYFVMELIRGLPITQFCDRHRLGTRERLALMLPVCLAVQHAHQKGIIHRDLKPSNVIVTMHDGQPVPKVIDFGIAKALHTPLTDRTLFTEFRQVMGTPEYMSPEQAETAAVDIDTRTDVFSLGVLMYELLTGTTPLDGETLRKADYGEMQRLIRDAEPPTPSRRLVTLTARGSRAVTRPTTRAVEIARARNSDPEALGRTLRGELDWIVMKCLEKDRRRRYESASALAEDIRRYLANEAVLASPPSTLYRLRKYAQRHRFAVAFAAVVAGAVAVAFAGVTWGLMEVMAERDRVARAFEASKNSVRETWAATDLLRDFVAFAAKRRKEGSTYSVDEMLVDFDAALAARFVARPEQEVQMRLALADVYEVARPEMHLREIELAARRAREALPATDPLLAAALEGLAYARMRTGRAHDALRVAHEAIALRSSCGGSPWLSWIVCIGAHAQLGQCRAMRDAAQHAVAAAVAATGEGGAECAFAVTSRGGSELAAGNVADALPDLKKAIELRIKAVGAEHQSVRGVRCRLAVALALLGDVEQAEGIVAAAEREQLAHGTPLDWSFGVLVAAQSACAMRRGRFDEAIAAYRRLLASDAEHRTAGDPLAVENRVACAELLLDCGDVDAARELATAALSSIDDQSETSWFPRLRGVLAVCELRRGDSAGALEDLEAVFDIQRRDADADAPLLAGTMVELAAALVDRGAYSRAAELAGTAAGIYERNAYPRTWVDCARALAALARARLGEKGSAAAFAELWQRLEADPSVLPAQRERFAAAARDAGIPSPERGK